jgi:hypothetical protein
MSEFDSIQWLFRSRRFNDPSNCPTCPQLAYLNECINPRFRSSSSFISSLLHNQSHYRNCSHSCYNILPRCSSLSHPISKISKHSRPAHTLPWWPTIRFITRAWLIPRFELVQCFDAQRSRSGEADSEERGECEDEKLHIQLRN